MNEAHDEVAATGAAIPDQDLEAEDTVTSPGRTGPDGSAPIRLFNTAARQVEPLETIEPGRVRMYVCGISVSGPPHVGHGRSYVVFDVLRRVLEHAGYVVDHVQNFTDIEEPIVRRAREQGLDPATYAQRMEDAYFEAMDRLDVLHADRFPHVTDYIDRIIDATETLEDHECAYTIDDGVAFRVCDIEGFGDLLGKDPAQAVVATVDEDEIAGRDSPFDFVLWRNRDDVGVTWETPWGTGRPGWHTECAVMATDLLGASIDIHGGGADLVFPHHECERAIARCLTDEPFARYWVHNGLVTLEEDKMSKSLRNTVPLASAIDEHGAAVVRTSYVLAPYRETIEWTDDLLAEAADVVDTLHAGLVDAAPGRPEGEVERLGGRVVEALRTDLRFPDAIGALVEVAEHHAGEPGARAVLTEGLQLLGLAGLAPFSGEVEAG